MNKFLKVIYAMLAGFDVVFSLFIPMAIGLLWNYQFGSEWFASQLILIIAMVVTIYRAINFFVIDEK